MAGAQLARSRAPETMDEFVARRQREEARRDADYAVGRDRWSASTRSGQNHTAARPSDVVALGAQQGLTGRSSAAPSSPTIVQSGGTRYGSLYAPPPDDVAELRRQQAEFRATRREIADQNSWMSVPALAPVAVGLGLGGAAAAAASLVGPTARHAPLVLKRLFIFPRGGDSPAAAAGRRAHAALKERVNAKPGWDGEKNIVTKHGVRRPDVQAPPRKGDPDLRKLMELKPDTPRGHKEAARAVKRYELETGRKTRAIFYDPKDYM